LLKARARWNTSRGAPMRASSWLSPQRAEPRPTPCR
jgi:hypothetical protein